MASRRNKSANQAKEADIYEWQSDEKKPPKSAGKKP